MHSGTAKNRAKNRGSKFSGTVSSRSNFWSKRARIFHLERFFGTVFSRANFMTRGMVSSRHMGGSNLQFLGRQIWNG